MQGRSEDLGFVREKKQKKKKKMTMKKK